MAGVNRRKHFRHALLAVAAAAALGASGPAAAMPPLLVAAGVAVGALATGGVTAFLGTAAFWGLTVGQVIFAGSLAYGVYQAHEARKDARRAYNNSLQDRNVTLYGGEVPWQIIYGEAPVKPAVAAILTSGDRDEYKHVVTVWANHECEGCTDVRIAGESIGPLDVDGWVISSDSATTETTAATATVVLDASGNGTLPHAPLEIFDVQFQFSGDGGFDYATPTYTPGNPAFSVAGWGSRTVSVSYTRATSNTRVRVRHFNGSPDQVADPVLMALLPTEWTASDRLRGTAYSIWTFDLNEPELQGGIPDLSAVWRGKKLYDPRTGLTAWSANNALCVRDFLRAEYGKRCTEGQVTNSSFGTAANACDEALVEFDDAPRYTCNGAFRTDEDPDQVLRQLLQSMGGTATFAGTWHVTAGVYTAPVMDLTDADNAGAVESIPSPTGLQVFNGLRGKFYDPDKADQRTDYPPYSNAAFVAEDGGALWSPLDLPFTNEAWRCHNLARIFVERSRAEQLTFPAKLRALRLRCGQRVRLTNSYLGFTNAVFRVVKKEWAPGQPVTLLLQQDDATWWDTVDAPATTPPAADNNPDPWVVAPPTGLAVVSSDAVALRAADGAVISRVRVTVDASTDALVTATGALQVQTMRVGDSFWQQHPEAPGSATQTYLQGLREGEQYLVQVRWRNGLGAVSDYRTKAVVVEGDTTPPGPVEEFGVVEVPGGLLYGWKRCTDVDYLRTVLQLHPGGGESTVWVADQRPLYVADDTTRFQPWPPDGTYAVLARHEDRSGNLSDLTARVTYTIVDQTISGITRVWLQADGTPSEWLYGVPDPEAEDILVYEPAWWTGGGGSLLMDTPQIKDGAATLVYEPLVSAKTYPVTVTSFALLLDGREILPVSDCYAEVTAVVQGAANVSWDYGLAGFLLVAFEADDPLRIPPPWFHPEFEDLTSSMTSLRMQAATMVGLDRASYTLAGRFQLSAGKPYVVGAAARGSSIFGGDTWAATAYGAQIAITLIRK